MTLFKIQEGEEGKKMPISKLHSTRYTQVIYNLESYIF